jgi:plasmid stabilization system protein ParE
VTGGVLTRRARLVLIEIADYIAERNPDAADRLIERLVAACDMPGRRRS